MNLDTSKKRAIIAIDLKSFYASAEVAAIGRDPLTTNLVVADPTRTDKTICLAVSPSLKSYGIPGRPRLFEVIQRVREVNRERFARAKRLGLLTKGDDGAFHFKGSSTDLNELEADPALEVAYITASPRMKMYEEISTGVFAAYSRYVSPEDIHVYSIDECFIDATAYLDTYHMTAHELAMKMIRDVLEKTSITATVGIGTNLYLAKVAMDIVAKHAPADKDGVRISELDEMTYRELLWCHKPITDFWRVGRGIAKRLERLGCYTMGDVARQSVIDENVLYKAFGVNAELLIDHAWGWEPTEISMIKSYRSETNSISSGQVLMEPYDFDKGKLIVREMTELLALDLVRKAVVTKKIMLTITYDRESLICTHYGETINGSVFTVAKTGKKYTGEVTEDFYGRIVPKYAHGTGNIDRWTSSSRRIVEAMMELYERVVDPDLLVRKVTVVACDIIRENEVPDEEPEQLSLFVDYSVIEDERAREKAADDRERRMQKATLALQEKFGKNAVLKGINLEEGATTIQRNSQIGGHKAER